VDSGDDRAGDASLCDGDPVGVFVSAQEDREAMAGLSEEEIMVSSSKRKMMFDVVVVDPNFPVNDGWYKFPISVTSGMQIGMDGKYVVVGETMVIRNRRHFLSLWEMWGRPA
jgi:hypothetical protein